MANIDTTTAHPAMDMAEHERTYRLFITLAKYLTIFCILLLVFMAWFLL